MTSEPVREAAGVFPDGPFLRAAVGGMAVSLQLLEVRTNNAWS
jgi:hypothetical protein